MTTVLRTVLILAALALISYGMWKIYPPLAYIITGVYWLAVLFVNKPAPSKGK